MAMSLLIFLPFIKMDTPSETSISWGPIISNALARIALVLGFRSAIELVRYSYSYSTIARRGGVNLLPKNYKNISFFPAEDPKTTERSSLVIGYRSYVSVKANPTFSKKMAHMPQPNFS